MSDPMFNRVYYHEMVMLPDTGDVRRFSGSIAVRIFKRPNNRYSVHVIHAPPVWGENTSVSNTVESSVEDYDEIARYAIRGAATAFPKLQLLSKVKLDRPNGNILVTDVGELPKRATP